MQLLRGLTCRYGPAMMPTSHPVQNQVSWQVLISLKSKPCEPICFTGPTPSAEEASYPERGVPTKHFPSRTSDQKRARSLVDTFPRTLRALSADTLTASHAACACTGDPCANRLGLTIIVADGIERRCGRRVGRSAKRCRTAPRYKT